MAVLSVPKLGTELWEILGTVLDSPRTIWAACVGIYSINYVVVCMRRKMVMDFGFTKWNRCWVSGLPMDSPLFCFGTVKTVPGLCELDQKLSMCCVHELCGNCV